uniref:Uncharacterized protein n=1 Tax=Rhizophora mucronata TaxID=61149 RepID=A0A2P2N2V4_RHIMU
MSSRGTHRHIYSYFEPHSN